MTADEKRELAIKIAASQLAGYVAAHLVERIALDVITEYEIAMSGFEFGQRVRKKSGSSWQGHVRGYYVTDRTPAGACVESERERGSVQIYPASALEIAPEDTA